MGVPLAFFNGVRLWQTALNARERPATGAETRKSGLSRTRGLMNPRNPNFTSTISVSTTVLPIDGDTPNSKAAFSGYTRQATRMIYILKTLKQLRDQSMSFGDVAWVEDEDEYASITGGPYTGATGVTLSAPGFTPASGDYVLWRNPATGDGFVTAVAGYAGSVLSTTLQSYTLERDRTTGLPILQDRTITSSWLCYRVAYYWPRSSPILMDDPPAPARAEDKYAMNVSWQFVSETDAVFSTNLSVDLT